MILLLLAQAAAAPPDIQINATIDIRSVRIEKRGQASLSVRADPDAGSIVRIEAPKADGARTLRDVRVTVDAEARIAPTAAAAAQETVTTPPR